jgi:hypothetical protein
MRVPSGWLMKVAAALKLKVLVPPPDAVIPGVAAYAGAASSKATAATATGRNRIARLRVFLFI